MLFRLPILLPMINVYVFPDRVAIDAVLLEPKVFEVELFWIMTEGRTGTVLNSKADIVFLKALFPKTGLVLLSCGHVAIARPYLADCHPLSCKYCLIENCWRIGGIKDSAV